MEPELPNIVWLRLCLTFKQRFQLRQKVVAPGQFCKVARLFAKLPLPGDSEVTFVVFESTCHQL